MSLHFRPQAKMAPLSIYMPRDEFDHSFVLWRRAVVYMMDSTGETGEPCGVPTAKLKGSDEWPLKQSLTVRSCRKEWHHPTISGGKPRSARIWTSYSWFMLLTKPLMHIRRRLE